MNNASKAVHAHPFSIFTYLYRYIFLLIIPVARGFFTGLTGGFAAWLSGAWLDVLIVVAIISLAYLKWDNFKYYMDIHGIYYTYGIFFKRAGFIPAQKISTFAVMKPFWLRPLRVSKVRVDTIALRPQKADLEFFVSFDQADRLQDLFNTSPLTQGNVLCQYRPSIMGVVFLSLFTSNSFIGIVLMATFISQMGQILGRQFNDFVFYTFEELSRLLAIGIPPIAAGAALILVAGWLIAFCFNLLQTKNLCTRRTQHGLQIGGGVITQKHYELRISDISFVDIRQSLLTKLFRLYSVYLNAIGFGKEKDDISAIIPFSTQKRTLNRLSLLLPEYRISPRQLKPNFGAVFKFIIDPFWPCVLIPAGTLVAAWFLPNWTSIIRFTGFMLSVPAFWFLGVRLVDFATSGISKIDDYYTLRYSKLYYIHTVVFNWDKIALINIRQSILQRGDDKCDIVISTRAEGRRTHHIRNLDRQPSLEIFHAHENH